MDKCRFWTSDLVKIANYLFEKYGEAIVSIGVSNDDCFIFVDGKNISKEIAENAL